MFEEKSERACKPSEHPPCHEGQNVKTSTLHRPGLQLYQCPVHMRGCNPVYVGLVEKEKIREEDSININLNKAPTTAGLKDKNKTKKTTIKERKGKKKKKLYRKKICECWVVSSGKQTLTQPNARHMVGPYRTRAVGRSARYLVCLYYFIVLLHRVQYKYVVRSFLPDGVFLPSDHGLYF